MKLCVVRLAAHVSFAIPNHIPIALWADRCWSDRNHMAVIAQVHSQPHQSCLCPWPCHCQCRDQNTKVVKEWYIIHASSARYVILDHARTMGTMGYSEQLTPQQWLSSSSFRLLVGHCLSLYHSVSPYGLADLYITPPALGTTLLIAQYNHINPKRL